MTPEGVRVRVVVEPAPRSAAEPLRSSTVEDGGRLAGGAKETPADLVAGPAPTQASRKGINHTLPKIDKVKVGDVELPATTEMSVIDKLRRYLLNTEHPQGASKAKWFKEALGFTNENIDELVKQIRFDPSKAVQTTKTPVGVKY